MTEGVGGDREGDEGGGWKMEMDLGGAGELYINCGVGGGVGEDEGNFSVMGGGG